MTKQADYMTVALQVAKHMDAYRLAFKTYSISELDSMMKETAGQSARVNSGGAFRDLENAFLQRGFSVFPSLEGAQDGFVRIFRTNSILGNLITTLRFVGSNGDAELAKLLTQLKNRARPDDFDSIVSDV